MKLHLNFIIDKFREFGRNYFTVDDFGKKLEERFGKGLKQKLIETPLTLVYQLETPTIKTVDLTITNQDGEPCVLKPIEGKMCLSTDGETIKPTFTGEIPIEAITQNLASFIEE